MRDPFQTTRWSRVLAAGGEGEDARDALGWLCETYWAPVYAFVRRRGFDAEDARDVTQSYFATLMEKRVLDRVDPRHGRFRAFLLATIKNYLSQIRQHRAALKRGGTQQTVQLDEAEAGYQVLRSEEATPEEHYERQWALIVLERATSRLSEEFRQANRFDRFEALRPILTGDDDSLHGESAKALGISEGAFAVLLHRTRKRLGTLLRDEVAQTLAEAKNVDDEVRHLLRVVSR